MRNNSLIQIFMEVLFMIANISRKIYQEKISMSIICGLAK